MATDWLELKDQGNVHFTANQFDEALVCYNAALEIRGLQPKDQAEVHRCKAGCYIKMGRYLEAIDEASKCELNIVS